MADTAADTKTKAKKDKAEATPEQKAARLAGKAIVKALAKAEGGNLKERKARLTENKKEYASQARKLLRAMAAEGVGFTIDKEKTVKAKRAAQKANRAGGDDE